MAMIEASAEQRRRGGAYAALPAVSAVVDEARAAGSRLSPDALVRAVQDALAEERAAIAAGAEPARAEIAARVVDRVLALDRPRLSAGINATGVIVHTNLGRAPVSAETAAAMVDAATHATPLEIDPETNERGGRMSEISALIRILTGAEAALAVNNCASALVLALSALASGREVVVSRGEAVEIGGGFRVPDVMRQSGADLVEVGTTNRTYARDYLDASGERTAAWLKVHASNFRIVGFTHAPALDELVAAARPRGILVLDDLGSGAMFDTRPFGLAAEPTLPESIAAGADVAMISGDKLLGGPQAGILAGRAEAIARVAKHPLARAVRADKTTLAGLAATLRHHARGEALERIPVWRAISADPEALHRRATELSGWLGAAGIVAEVAPMESTIGGGSVPGASLPSWGLALRANGPAALEALAGRLRLGSPAAYGRIERDRFLLDLRTVMPEEDHALAAAATVAAKG